MANTGGHLTQLTRLAPRLDVGPGSEWITFDTPQARTLLQGKKAHFVPYISPRDWQGIARAAWLTRHLRRRFDGVVSTGAGLALAILPAMALHNEPAIFIWSSGRCDVPRRPARAEDWRTLRAEVGGQPVANVLAGAVSAMPQVLLPALGHTVLAGTWALVNRFLAPLVNTAYNTLQPLYYGRAAHLTREGDAEAMSRFNRRWMLWLLAAGVPVMLGCAFISGVLLPLLGDQWSVGWWPTIAGAVYFGSLFSCLPLSQTLQMLGEVRLAVIWTAVRFAVCALPLLFIQRLGSNAALLGWAVGGALTYLWQLWLQRRVLHHAAMAALGAPATEPSTVRAKP